MKKLIAIILLLGGIGFAQTNGALKGGGIIFADSLCFYQDTTGYYSGTGWLHPSDSSAIINLNLDWGFVSITVQDTGVAAASGGIVDSLKAYKGSVRYTNSISHTIVDTIWGTKALPFKNNGWNVDTTMVSASGQVSTYTLLDNNIQLLKIMSVNIPSSTYEGRVIPFIVEAKKN